jgi:hypothetical protein
MKGEEAVRGVFVGDSGEPTFGHNTVSKPLLEKFLSPE